MGVVELSEKKEAVSKALSRFEKEGLSGHVEIHFHAGNLSKMFCRFAEF